MGTEALAYWLQPDSTLLQPGEFIPLAEETGLIVEIGNFAFRTACEQIKAWQTAGLDQIRLTVNVSACQLRKSNFIETICKMLDDTQTDPSYLQIEFTEISILQNIEDTVRKLHELQEIGIQISIDDFGTGCNSVNYLKRFFIATVKIDQSFIKDLSNNKPVVKAIISFAHNLNLTVIAEGVETAQQLSFLKEFGCDGIQGNLICQPISGDEIALFIREKKYANIINIENCTEDTHLDSAIK
jgi:EAL domain-containing protein (putative c-di-GMP-specific phosphodiesterase class I)